MHHSSRTAKQSTIINNAELVRQHCNIAKTVLPAIEGNLEKIMWYVFESCAIEFAKLNNTVTTNEYANMCFDNYVSGLIAGDREQLLADESNRTNMVDELSSKLDDISEIVGIVNEFGLSPRWYGGDWLRELGDNGFASNCIDGNRMDELVNALREQDADTFDCSNYEITAEQWRQSIRIALESQIYSEYEFLYD